MSEIKDSASTNPRGTVERTAWSSQELLAEVAPIIEEELRAQGLRPDDPEYATRYRTARACMERLIVKAISMSREIDNDTTLKEETE
jgi:hypothetical protein